MSADGPEARRCGLVAVIGAPNVGKSTLVNRLVGTKVSIVSPRVQTTRSRIMGVAMAGPAQIVLVDTPGIFLPKRRLERAMVRAAWDGAGDSDIVLLLIDAERGLDGPSARIAERVIATARRPLAAINKIDKVRREALLRLAAEARDKGFADSVFMISALTGDGVEDLRKHLAAAMPEGPWLFPEDQVSDLPARLWAAEVTREQVFHLLRDELPHASAVATDAWIEQEDGAVRIEQTIYVQREGQKAIVLGAGGRQIKEIGSRARAELETTLERRVHLFLNVKQRADWQDDRGFYGELGLAFDA